MGSPFDFVHVMLGRGTPRAWQMILVPTDKTQSQMCYFNHFYHHWQMKFKRMYHLKPDVYIHEIITLNKMEINEFISFQHLQLSLACCVAEVHIVWRLLYKYRPWCICLSKYWKEKIFGAEKMLKSRSINNKYLIVE